MRVPALALAALAVGCGGGQTSPPRGPHHDPVNSPEARSECPDEWKAAKKAREELLGAMGDERRRAAAATAVLAQARCEHARFERWTIDAGSQKIMAAELRAARVQYLTARTLYQEVAGYHVKPSEIGAHALDAELHMAFVRKLDRLPVPVDLHDPAARAGFKGDMRALMSTFEVEAALAASRALDAAGGEQGASTEGPPAGRRESGGRARSAPGGTTRERAAKTAGENNDVAGWLRSSCEILATLDPESRAGYPVCRSAGGG